jgi:CMP-N,N'-diacetyllegionaminic acid synthase
LLPEKLKNILVNKKVGKMKILALIPARGGSKGIPNKNIKKLNGKPLIQYTIEAAREVFDDADICVSTDSPQIKKVVEDIGLKVSFLRPDDLATDLSGTHEVILHALDYYAQVGKNYEVLVLLQPTSPLRTVNHIKEAISLFSLDIDMVVSVKETSANPYYVLFEEDKKGFLEQSKKGNFRRRQDCPKVWEYNGAVYVINVESIKKNPRHKLKKIKRYVMDEMTSIDIDTPTDWLFTEYILLQLKSK